MPAMSSESRNFRLGYYDKVGFQAIDEKRSFEVLIREKPPDLMIRLANFTSRFKLSSVFRRQVWMLLLKVTEPDESLSLMKQEVGRQTVCDIVNALQIMLLIPSNIAIDPKVRQIQITEVDYSLDGHSKVFVLVHLLQTKRLNTNVQQQLKQANVLDLLTISMVFSQEFLFVDRPYSFEDACTLFTNFISLVHANFASIIEVYEKFIQTLASEDDCLYQHLVANGIIKDWEGSSSTDLANNNNNSNTNNGTATLNQTVESGHNYHANDYRIQSKLRAYRPLATWFVRFHCGTIHHTFVLRVLDKVIGSIIYGSRPFQVLQSVSRALINHWRDQLLLLQGEEALTQRLLSPLSLEESEKVVVSALKN